MKILSQTSKATQTVFLLCNSLLYYAIMTVIKFFCVKYIPLRKSSSAINMDEKLLRNAIE